MPLTPSFPSPHPLRLVQRGQVSKLDKWKTTLLLRIKNALKDSDLT